MKPAHKVSCWTHPRNRVKEPGKPIEQAGKSQLSFCSLLTEYCTRVSSHYARKANDLTVWQEVSLLQHCTVAGISNFKQPFIATCPIIRLLSVRHALFCACFTFQSYYCSLKGVRYWKRFVKLSDRWRNNSAIQQKKTKSWQNDEVLMEGFTPINQHEHVTHPGRNIPWSESHHNRMKQPVEAIECLEGLKIPWPDISRLLSNGLL